MTASKDEILAENLKLLLEEGVDPLTGERVDRACDAFLRRLSPGSAARSGRAWPAAAAATFFLVCGAVAWRGFSDARPAAGFDADREARELVARLAHDDPAERDRAANDIEGVGLDFQFAVFRMGQLRLYRRLAALFGSRPGLVGHAGEDDPPESGAEDDPADANKVKLELYDVRDLIGDGSGKPPGTPTALEFIGRVKNEVRPGEWEGSRGRSLRFDNGILIARNIPSVNRALRRFLVRLRRGATEPRDLPSRPSVASWVDRLATGGADDRLAALARKVDATLAALDEGARSSDGELKGRAAKLAEKFRANVRGAASHDLLRRAAVEDVRALWLKRDPGRFEDGVRAAFSFCEIASLRVVTEVRVGDNADELRRETVDALDRGEGIVRLDSHRPFAPPGVTLLFTLPEGTSWKAYVAVRFGR